MLEDESPLVSEPEEGSLRIQGLVLSWTAPEIPFYLFTQRRLDKRDCFSTSHSQRLGAGEAGCALGSLPPLRGHRNQDASYSGLCGVKQRAELTSSRHPWSYNKSQ